MSKVLRVTMPDQTVWDIPLTTIADSRATYFATRDEIIAAGQYTKVYEHEYQITMNDSVEAKDWAANHMDWQSVALFATKIFTPPPESPRYEEWWRNADMEVAEIL